MNQPLIYMDCETLMNTVLPPIRFVISQLLPQGLHVLAGAPKVGKSWLSLWLCLQVAKGEPAWEFPTTQGDVLYLCLEDSYSRIQNRLLDITDDAPPNLFFATVPERLHSGLEQQIERFLTELRRQSNNLNHLVNFQPFTEVYQDTWRALNSMLSRGA